jgi:hypothetical protein
MIAERAARPGGALWIRPRHNGPDAPPGLRYAAYLAFLHKWGVIPKPVAASEVITNGLIDDINKFDPQAVIARAKAAK